MASSLMFDVVEHTIQASHIREYPHATGLSQDEALLLHVKQYVPKDSRETRKGDVTIVAAHANGFPKELYEPLWDELYEDLKKQGIRVRAIWIADAAWQGRSAHLNAGKLGNDPGWFDYSRDVIHMINTFRMPRPIIAVGHSFGANALVNASLMHPRLFSGMTLLDPVIDDWDPSVPAIYQSPAAMSVKRRDVWPSRELAAKSFKKSPFYGSWDPRALEQFIKYGLKDVPGSKTGEVELATTKHQEVFTFIRPLWPAYDEQGEKFVHPEQAPDIAASPKLNREKYPLYRPEGINTFHRLPNLRPAVLYIFGGKSNVSPPHVCRKKMETTGTGVGGSGGAKACQVTQVTGDDYGHLIPMESPRFCSQAMAGWFVTQLDQWRAEEAAFEEWMKKPAAEKETISEDLRMYLGAGKEQSQQRKEKANL